MQSKRVLVLMLGLVVTISFVYSAGGRENAASTQAPGGPQYGGTFTTVLEAPVEPPSPAIADSQFASLYYLEYMQERLVQGDIEKYGPRGSGEYIFQTLGYQPEKYLRGCVLESWEISREKIVWRVRPGIYWAPTESQKAWMKARELTAEDVALDLIRFMDSPWNGRFKGLTSSANVKAIDKYTVEIKFDKYSNLLMYYIAYEDRALVSPPETETAGANQWANQVGTGPWMFDEYVFGSYMSYKRNPNYWGKTTIDGKEYQLPFIDRAVIPIIFDRSTELAALKTGKVDLSLYTAASEWGMLDKEAPSMAVYNYAGTASSGAVYFRCDEPPFNNVKVRQALTLGTDIEAFKKVALATASPTVWLPILPGDPAYVPLDKLPKDIQDLYKYNPTLAKQMLAEAGFPAGTLKTTIYCDTTAFVQDEAALLKSQWEKIGVELSIKTVEGAELYKMMLPVPKPTFHGLCRDSFPPSANPLVFFDQVYKTTGGLNYGQYSSAEIDGLLAKALQEASADERTRLLKQIALIGLRDAYGIPLHLDLGKIYAWPWVKNYFGEISLQDDCGFSAIVKYIWLDQDLKAKMGYK